jgi:hypothetical protein
VVRQDPAGSVRLPGKPPLTLVRTERIGGRWDLVLRRFIGPAERHLVWHVSEIQAEVVLGQQETATRTLLYAAEGGGKTVTGAAWAVVQIIRMAMAGVFVFGGATAPTHERLLTLVKAVRERIPTDDAKSMRPGVWATWYADARELRFVTGHVIQFRSTKKQSAATGSPVQGFTWAFSLDDELQDTVEGGADADIEARLRGVRTSRRLGTATAKDSPKWRTFRDSRLASPDWRILRIPYDQNPFVWPDHWDRMRRNVSEREWRRRGLALDVGPERMVYHTWERDKNLRPVPEIGAEDVTQRVLNEWGPYNSILVGHDPGKLQHVSVLLKAYLIQGTRKHAWWVVDEVTTEGGLTETHVLALQERLQKWGCYQKDFRGQRRADCLRALIRADPYSDSGNDAQRPDRSVYKLFRNAGLDIMPAAYAKAGTGPGRVPKEAGINMVAALLCNAAQERRLFIACDSHRQPAAPKLVESIELSERDAAGDAETQKKGVADLSHWPAALRYALWTLEKPRIEVAA